MVSTRLLGLVSTVLLVVGALLVGQGFHLSLVTDEIAVTSASFALHVVLGTVLIALGYRARRPVAEAYDLTGDESGADERAGSPGAGTESGTPGTGEDTAFDPSLSPLGEAAPGGAERERAERDDRPDRETTTDGERDEHAPGDVTDADRP